MSGNSGAWNIARFIISSTALLVIALAAAVTNGVVVFSGARDDLVVIMLTAATVVLTGVAVAIGIFAFWGYGEIKTKMVEAARQEAQRVAPEVAKEAAAPIAARTAHEAIEPALDQLQALLESIQSAQRGSEPEPGVTDYDASG